MALHALVGHIDIRAQAEVRSARRTVYAVWKSGRPFDPDHYPWEAAESGTAPAGGAGGSDDPGQRARRSRAGRPAQGLPQ